LQVRLSLFFLPLWWIFSFSFFYISATLAISNIILLFLLFPPIYWIAQNIFFSSLSSKKIYIILFFWILWTFLSLIPHILVFFFLLFGLFLISQTYQCQAAQSMSLTTVLPYLYFLQGQKKLQDNLKLKNITLLFLSYGLWNFLSFLYFNYLSPNCFL